MPLLPVAPWMHDSQHPAHVPDRYIRPTSVNDVTELLREFGDDAKIVAGGTDLMVELDRRVSSPSVLIDLTGVSGLDSLSEERGRIECGPLVTHNQAATSPLVTGRALPLAQAALEVGSPALRNRATIVGNVVTASPANDTISALRALDTMVVIRSSEGSRSVDLGDFHTGVRRTLLASDEMVSGLSIRSLGAADRGVYVKLGLRRAQAISVVHLAIVLRVSTSGQISEARIALGSVAPTIVTVPEAEANLVASEIGFDDLSSAVVDSLADQCCDAITPIDDGRATGDHRRDQVAVMVRRALTALANGTHADAHPSAPPTLGGPVVPKRAELPAVDARAGDVLTARVNGSEVSAPTTGTTMLDWLRDSVGLTGTKEGCAEGECGACTVHLEGAAVLSCLVPDGRANGASIVTIEGLGSRRDGDTNNAELHAMQQSFIDCAAVQCGYCIPGFVMAAACLEPAEASDDAARKLGLSGNLCRCTGYYAIERAVGRASAAEEETS